jgi:SDR family mycofactocin-dependent oxidoreductase
MAGRVEGKVALITGAARGQGRSHAVRLAQEGADIIAIDICDQIGSVPYAMATPQDLQETASQVKALDRRIVARQADVRDLAALRTATAEAVRELGRLDIVSVNAGIWSSGLAEDLSEQQWRDMIDVSLSGAWFTVQATLPHIRAGGRGGSIVLTSSLAGLTGGPGLAHYIAAKHGVTGIMRAMSQELAPESIRVNSLHPTQVNTDMLLNDAIRKLFVPGIENPSMGEMQAVSAKLISMPIPWVESIDVSNALLYLASDEARYITGVAFPVDGGGRPSADW